MSFNWKVILLLGYALSGMLLPLFGFFIADYGIFFSCFSTMQYSYQYHSCLPGRHMFHTSPSMFPSLIRVALAYACMLQNNVNDLSMGLVFPPIQASGFSADEFLVNLTVPSDYGYAGFILGSSLAK